MTNQLLIRNQKTENLLEKQSVQIYLLNNINIFLIKKLRSW